MASSPGTGPPPESSPVSSPTPFPPTPPPQEIPQPTTADPLEPAQSDHAKPTPQPHPVKATATSPEAYESPAPMDGSTREAGRPPLLSPQEATPASPALEAARPEEHTPVSPPPLVEVFPEAAARAASPIPSPQIVAASAAAALPPSTTPSPPASTSTSAGASRDAPLADSAAMASEEVARLPAALEPTDADPLTAQAPATKNVAERLSPQQHLRPISSTSLIGCENFELGLLRPPPLAETTHDLSDAAGTDEIDVAEEAAGTSPAVAATDEKTDSALAGPLIFENDAEGSSELPVLTPRSPQMEGELCSLEMAPPGFESFKSSWTPLLPATLQAETTHSLRNAAATEAMAVPEEAARSLPILAVDTMTDTKPGLPSPESLAEGPLQQPLLRPPSPITQAEPCSPDTPPPGFENFKLSWLPQPNETTYASSVVVATKAVAVTLEEAILPVPTLEAMDVETDTACNLLPPLENDPLLRPTTPMPQSAPCSPQAPPGFENSESSWPPLSTALSGTAHISPDETATEPLAMTFKEATGPTPTIEAIDVKIRTKHPLLLPLESGVEGSLKEPQQKPPSPTMQDAPCSPQAPPGFENSESSWPPLSTALSGTAYITPDETATEPLATTFEEATGPSPAIEAIDVKIRTKHPLLLPLESGVEGSLQEPQQKPPSPTMQDAPGSPDMAPPGFENFKSSQLLQHSPPLTQTAYTLHDPATIEAVNVSEETARTLPALEGMGVNMDTSSENGAGSFQQQPARLPCPMEKGTACSPEIVPSGPENLESLQLSPLPVLPQVQTPDALVDVVAIEAVVGPLEEVHHPPPVLLKMEEGTAPIRPPLLESGSEGSLPQLEPHVHSVTTLTVDTLTGAPATKSVAVESEERAPPQLALQAVDTNMECATTLLTLSKKEAEDSLPQLQHPPCSQTVQAAPCSPEALELLPPPPPPFLNKEMGQMVCGCCRELLAYPRGAVHVQCAGCLTINLVLEAHEVGKVHCGRCETLLMYPFGAPAVKCSLCLFVTEIGERKVRPRISVEQVVPPHPPELANQS